jgi:hypothetical protein
MHNVVILADKLIVDACKEGVRCVPSLHTAVQRMLALCIQGAGGKTTLLIVPNESLVDIYPLLLVAVHPAVLSHNAALNVRPPSPLVPHVAQHQGPNLDHNTVIKA